MKLFDTLFIILYRSIINLCMGNDLGTELTENSFLPYDIAPLTLSLSNFAKSKFRPNFQISFCEILKNK